MHFVEGNRKPQYVLNNRSLFQLKCAVSGEVKKKIIFSMHLLFSLSFFFFYWSSQFTSFSPSTF